MKQTTLLLTLIILLFSACKKDKDQITASSSGYYKGYLDQITDHSIFRLAILNRSDGTSRWYIYNAPTSLDTGACHNKVEGTWSLAGNNFKALYSWAGEKYVFQGSANMDGSSINGTIAINSVFATFTAARQ